MRWTIAICALLGLAAVQDSGPRIRIQGEIILLNASGVDLDDGRVGGYIVTDVIFDPGPPKLTFKGSDFWFRAGSKRYFVPQHGALFSKTAFTVASYSECAAATYTKGEIRIDELPREEQICLHTNEDRYASIQIKSYDSKRSLLSISHVTWEK